MQVRPFTIFTRTELDTIRRRLDDLLAAWGEKWFVNTTSLPAAESVSNISEVNVTVENGFGTERKSANGDARIVYCARVVHRMYMQATGDNAIKVTLKNSQTSPESALTQKMFDDLLALILGDASVSTVSGTVELPAGKGSGTVVASIADQDYIWQLHLSRLAARALAGKSATDAPPARLALRKACIGKGMLKLRVTAGEAELRLADLMELKPGNVIRLNMQPHQPFAVEAADDGQKICSAYLGKRDGNKAVELIN